jgi:hypothetical protein
MTLRMSTTARRLATLLLSVIVLAVGWLALGQGRADPPARMFSDTSFWNAPLRRDAPVDGMSTLYVTQLAAQVRLSGAWINSGRFSTPVYTVGPDQPRVRVTLDTPSAMYTNASDAAALQQQLAAVPIPPDARAAAGTDAHLVIWQPATDTMWELWRAHKAPRDDGTWHATTPAGWHAAWGGRIEGVSQSMGVNQYPFGATASGLPMAGGLMRIDELRSSSIDHALALAIPNTAGGRTRHPANRTDGEDPTPSAIPEGTRFRLDPAVNVASLHLHPVAEKIALAAQRYGIVLRDRADTVAFYAEDPRLPGSNPYADIYGGASPAKVLEGFPWTRLKVLVPGG